MLWVLNRLLLGPFRSPWLECFLWVTRRRALAQNKTPYNQLQNRRPITKETRSSFFQDREENVAFAGWKPHLTQSWWQWSSCRECQVENITDDESIFCLSIIPCFTDIKYQASWQDYSTIHPWEGEQAEICTPAAEEFIPLHEGPSHLPLMGFAPQGAPTLPSRRLSHAVSGWLQAGTMLFCMWQWLSACAIRSDVMSRSWQINKIARMPVWLTRR